MLCGRRPFFFFFSPNAMIRLETQPRKCYSGVVATALGYMRAVHGNGNKQLIGNRGSFKHHHAVTSLNVWTFYISSRVRVLDKAMSACRGVGKWNVRNGKHLTFELWKFVCDPQHTHTPPPSPPAMNNLLFPVFKSVIEGFLKANYFKAFSSETSWHEMLLLQGCDRIYSCVYEDLIDLYKNSQCYYILAQ